MRRPWHPWFLVHGLVRSQSRTLNLEHPVYVTQSPICMPQALLPLLKFYWLIWIYINSVFGRTPPTRCDVVFMLNFDCKHVFIVEYSSFGNITSSSFFHYGASTRQPVCFPIQCSVGSQRKGKERERERGVEPNYFVLQNLPFI